MKNTILFFTLFFVVGYAFAAGNIAAGKKIAEQKCAECHGIDGNKAPTSDYPRLAGQYPDYLVRTLLDYKSGARKDAAMGAQMATLCEHAEDTKCFKTKIEDVAAYYASLPSLLTVKK